MNLITLKNLQVPQNNPYGDKYKTEAIEWVRQGGKLKDIALRYYDFDELMEFTDIWLNTPREKEDIEMNPKHREYLETIAQIKAVADYLNGDWKPEIGKERYRIFKKASDKWEIRYNMYEYDPGAIYYKSKETAEMALAILKHKYESL